MNVSAGLVGASLLLATSLVLAQAGGRPETPVLSEAEYAVQLEEVVVRGQRPVQRAADQAPRWDRPKIELELESKPSRLQLAPRYTREEREDYETVRDRNNAEPRIKLFEVKF